MIYKFIIEKTGKSYECERVVTGKGELRQTIHIKGVGSKKDSILYGASKHSAHVMTIAANRIANEIIRGI
jgi:hypothetical protein